MRWIAIVLLLLSATLFAETQEAAYFRAMQAEESGDISLAIKTFEEALRIGGEYSDEISEILSEYYDALGIPSDKCQSVSMDASTEFSVGGDIVSFRFLGDLSAVGLYYDATKLDSDFGSSLQGSFSVFMDFPSGEKIHSLGLNVLGDLNFYNQDMPALDTNDWKTTVGLEYVLITNSLLLDVGMDLHIYQQEDVSPAFYAWLEYEFLKYNKYQVGGVLWTYYDMSGPLSAAIYGSLRKSRTYGFSFSVMAGARLEVDSTFDYVRYQNRYDAALKNVELQMNDYGWGVSNPFNQCLEVYGDQCYDWNIATIDSLNWVAKYEQLLSEMDVPTPVYWTKWFGPSVRARILFKFSNGLSLESKLNLFYSFVVDGPDKDYEKISRLSGMWTGFAYWNLGLMEIYGGLEDVFRMYNLSDVYKDVYSGCSNTLKIKLGTKWEF